MRAFNYSKTRAAGDAVMTVSGQPEAKFIAGGTTLVDLMRINVETPAQVVDINALPLKTIQALPGGGVRIGALARMSEVAEHPLIVQGFPAVSQALLLSASPQLRNKASIGGNLMQRTRCPYFRDTALPCNKREPGSGCSAIGGENRMLAILGTSENCIATNAGDMAVSMSALDAVVRIRGPKGDRTVNLVDFYVVPGSTPNIETVLQHGELILAIDLPAAPHAARSHYLKVRDRASYEFAVTSAAVGLDVQGSTIRSARVALGGVGTKPWRSKEAEAALVGRPATEATFVAAAQIALSGAKPRSQNAFKIPLAQRTLVKALRTLAGGGS
ncbi:xanthine dehydrogenase family protein subunit M [Deinococcus sp. Arct2-2]|uniref:FAD binding domain-containing protein n=1 Tax=Deinococcus sp. Arct2-2 TaxID=2568653 RepID=UPI0010A402C3|nr:xanthine dehydrogenase family protein subunit M [Deinococcus sp. Arct2-2]THF69576.1 xanthine dehydrogenase family protein subunit M [Deinococcus sp. Arct2-2]